MKLKSILFSLSLLIYSINSQAMEVAKIAYGIAWELCKLGSAGCSLYKKPLLQEGILKKDILNKVRQQHHLQIRQRDAQANLALLVQTLVDTTEPVSSETHQILYIADPFVVAQAIYNDSEYKNKLKANETTKKILDSFENAMGAAIRANGAVALQQTEVRLLCHQYWIKEGDEALTLLNRAIERECKE